MAHHAHYRNGSAVAVTLLLLHCGIQAQEQESPWLVVPTVSSDPKLSHSIGGVLGYLKRFDPASNTSMIAALGSYSDTDSWYAGLYSDLYFHGNRHKVIAGYIQGTIHNEYDDFLGTGAEARTDDGLDAIFARYSYLLGHDWYLGGQLISSNYSIGAGGFFGDFLSQVGLTGFDSTGVGLVIERETRDNVRNPTRGSHFLADNIAYRDILGGKESFDVYRGVFTHYLPFGNGNVLASQFQGRWTSSAPIGGYSSVLLRGYTRGNYLAENYSHADIDARFAVKDNWGVAVFTGIGCLYDSLSDCGGSDDLYPAAGAGIFYVLKPEAGIVIRVDAAVGKDDNSAIYLRLGQPY